MAEKFDQITPEMQREIAINAPELEPAVKNDADFKDGVFVPPTRQYNLYFNNTRVWSSPKPAPTTLVMAVQRCAAHGRGQWAYQDEYGHPLEI